MNVSIIGTQASGLGIVVFGGFEQLGIYVKSIRPSGPVAQDG